MKRIIGMLLTILIVLSLAAPVLAAGELTTASVSGIDAPVAGKLLDYSASVGSSDYKLLNKNNSQFKNGITWYDCTAMTYVNTSHICIAGHAYMAEVHIVPAAGKSFSLDATGIFNGINTGVVSGDETEIAIMYEFPPCAGGSSAAPKVVFTSGSSFKVGGTASVDKQATARSVLDSGSVTSDLYNAALERNMTFQWLCSNGPDKTGQSVTWSTEDAGREYVCRVGFYSDSACTDFVDYVDSQPFSITGGQSLRITINELHNPVLGEEYYVRMTSTDPNAVYSEFMGSELSSFGLKLHSNGVIDGIPTKTGNCHINIKAVGPTGEDSYSTDVTVIEPFEPSLEVLDEPSQTTYMQGDTFNPAGMRVKITTFDGSVVISENGKYLDYYKEPLQNLGDVKIKLSQGDLFTFVYIKVVPASSAGGGGDMPPSITLKSLPTAYVGEEYYVRIDCSDLDAEFWEYYNPGKANDLSKTGLIITDRGVLTGTPTKAGSFTFTICAGNDNGEDYATYTLTVKEAPEATEATTEETTEATTEVTTEATTEAATETTTEETTVPSTEQTGSDKNQDNKGTVSNSGDDGQSNVWLFVLIGLAAALVIAAVVIALVLWSKKKQSS